jgi:tetratricopeptide (TPR) repeat protein
LVCRLCGVANPPQQSSCTVCGAPLERSPQGRPAGAATPRTGWLLWLALCIVLGTALGIAVVHLWVGDNALPGSVLAGVLIGAAVGAGLGALPAPAMRAARRAWSLLMIALLDYLTKRRLLQIQKSCEEAAEESGSYEACVRLAAALWLADARDRAEQVALRSIRSPDASPLARHNLAVAQAQSGRRSIAMGQLEQLESEMGRSCNLWWNLGLARWGLGELAEAAEAFGKVIDLDASQQDARNARALVLARRGELNRAVTELEVVLGARRDPDALCNLGIVHQSRGDLEVAAAYFTSSLQRSPGHVAARYNRGVCEMLQGYHHSAVEDLSILTRSVPNHAWALVQKGVCWYRLGQTGRALDAVRRAVRARPNDAKVRYNAGTVMLREGLVEQALTDMERAYELDPKNVDVIVNLGVAAHLAGRLRQALDHFRAAVRVNHRHALARYNCAVAYTLLDQFDEAEAQATELMALYPDLPEALNTIGVIRLLQGHLVDAAEHFRRAADAVPRSAIVRANLGLAYYVEGDLPAAGEQLQYAISLDPKLAAAYDIAGRVAVRVNKIPEATEYFEALVKLEPSNPDAHSNLGLSYYKDDRLNQAMECFKRSLIFAPNSPEGHNDLGLAYAKNHMVEEAARHLRQVIDWRPDNPIAHSNLGLVYYFKGDTELAVTQWREVTRLSPEYARTREATRFSAYDDQEMMMRPVDRNTRVAHFPLKVAAFRHTFQLALDENDYRMELPWPDLAAVARWQGLARRLRGAVGAP